MITIKELAESLGRDIGTIRRRAIKHGIPMAWAINPHSNQRVLVLDPAAEKALRSLYPAKLKPGLPASHKAAEGVLA